MDERRVSTVSAGTAVEAPASAEVSSTQSAEGVEGFLRDMARRQCLLVDGLSAVVMLAPTRENPTGTTARFAIDERYALPAKHMKRLAEVAARAAKEGHGVAEPFSFGTGLLSARPEHQALAAPLRLMGRTLGASVCIVPMRDEEATSDGLARLDLTTAMFEAFLWRQQAVAEAQAKIQLRETLDLMDKALPGHDATEMSALFAQELQRRFGCVRVSVGLVHGHAVRVIAMSGQEHIDRRSELAESLEAVMEECADQDVEVRCPQPDDVDPADRRVVRAHQSLSQRFGPTAIASFPMRIDEGLIGVVVMERDAGDPFNDATLRLLRLIAEYMGPAIWTRRLADRGVLAVTRDRLGEGTRTLLGPEKTAAKLIAVAVLILLGVAFLIPVPDRVVGQGRIVADVRRQITVPFVGRIAEVLAKPGDQVQAGTVLIRMDTREATQKLAERRSELNRLRIREDQLRSDGKAGEAAMARAEAAGAAADITLLEDQITQSEIRAPIAGTVTAGQLDDRIGEVVEPASPLMEIADLNTLHAVLLIPESGIARVVVGREGEIALTGRPQERITITVTRVTPASEVYQQRNVYRVEADLSAGPDWLRPGMEGQAKVRGATTNLFTIYTRPLWDSLRLRWWWW